MEVGTAMRVRQSKVYRACMGRFPGNIPAASEKLFRMSSRSRMPTEENR